MNKNISTSGMVHKAHNPDKSSQLDAETYAVGWQHVSHCFFVMLIVLGLNACSFKHLFYIVPVF